MFKKSTTIATVAAAGIALLPGSASADGIQAAAQLEATAVVNSDKAVDLARTHAAKAKQAIERSERALQRAYAISLDEGKAAYVKFSAAAEAQSDNLATVVERSRGSLEREAADALAETGSMEAAIVSRLAGDLDNGEQAAAVGSDHASVAADVAVAVSGDSLTKALRRELDTVARKSADAQASLSAAVERLRQRSEGDSKTMLEGIADALRRGGRWDVSYEKTVGDDSSPVQVSVAAQAHASVGQGGRR